MIEAKKKECKYKRQTRKEKVNLGMDQEMSSRCAASSWPNGEEIDHRIVALGHCVFCLCFMDADEWME
jgi:hypothetical protein